MKKRIDILLVEKELVPSRTKAAEMIKRNLVQVNGVIINKPNITVSPDSKIEILQQLPFVSRGGEKLEKAIDSFKIQVLEKVCLDIGSSTGGFTDCLLKHGAKIIYAVDVGTNQLEASLRENKKVVVLEKTDIRNFVMPQKAHLIAVDVSFISVTKIIPDIYRNSEQDADIIILIKPQFEVGREYLNRNGIVTSPEAHKKAIENVTAEAEKNNLRFIELIDSPILGGSGNKEFLAHFTRQ